MIVGKPLEKMNGNQLCSGTILQRIDYGRIHMLYDDNDDDDDDDDGGGSEYVCSFVQTKNGAPGRWCRRSGAIRFALRLMLVEFTEEGGQHSLVVGLPFYCFKF